MAGKPGQEWRPAGQGKGITFLREHVAYDGDGCLIWPFSRTWNGYAQVGLDGIIKKAHREMCRLAHGEPPTPKHVAAHSCHNGKGGCVHPGHLSWETPSENTRQRREAGTLTKKKWSRHGSMTPEQLAQIIALKGKKNQREIGAMFGISYQHVSVIQNRRLKSQRSA